MEDEQAFDLSQSAEIRSRIRESSRTLFYGFHQRHTAGEDVQTRDPKPEIRPAPTTSHRAMLRDVSAKLDW